MEVWVFKPVFGVSFNQDDGRKEVMLETGSLVRLTTDDAFRDKCTEHLIWLDYKNITKVLSVGKRIFIDDGLISIKATEIGELGFWAATPNSDPQKLCLLLNLEQCHCRPRLCPGRG